VAETGGHGPQRSKVGPSSIACFQQQSCVFEGWVDEEEVDEVDEIVGIETRCDFFVDGQDHGLWSQIRWTT
jgi:hypothetical protein